MQQSEYDNISQCESTHWWFVSLHEKVIKSLAIEPHIKLLDAGCGTGGFLAKARKFLDNDSIFGIEISEHGIKHCLKKELSNAIIGTVSNMPYSNETFNTVVSLDVIYHKEVKSDLEALKEMHRVLKPGGKLILNLAAYEFLKSDFDELAHTERRYTKGSLRDKVKSAGFEIEQIHYRCCFIFPLVLFKRLVLNSIFKNKSKKTEFFLMPKLVNSCLLHLCRLENKLDSYISYPFGSSVFCIARKP